MSDRVSGERSRLSRRRAIQVAGAAGAGVAALAAGGVATGQPAGQAQGPATVAQLQRIGDSFYVFSFGGYNSVFVVTDEGVIVADPASLNDARAQLLVASIRAVTNQPVRFVIYSHDHADHATGGWVFAEKPEFVAQRRAAAKIAAQNNARVPVPTRLFDTAETITLGGKSVQLLYVGRNHSDNSLVLLYPAARVAFAVDFIPVRSLPFRTLTDGYPDEWVRSLEYVQANLDFDTLVPGHGPLGTKATVGEVRQYFLDLMAAIRAAQRQGLADNSEAMVAAVRAALAPKYGSWDNFGPYLPENILGLLRDGFSM